MLRQLGCTLLALSLPLCAADPQRSLQAAMQAMGGESLLKSIRTISLKSVSHRNLLEQSVRPEGPYLTAYRQITEYRDYDRRAIRTETSVRGFDSANWWDKDTFTTPGLTISTEQIAGMQRGDRWFPASPSQSQTTAETLALSPERMLLTAQAATDLKLEPNVLIHGVVHEVLAFTWQKHPVRIFLNGVTHLPTAIEFTRARPRDLYWAPWGDVTTRISFDGWYRESSGLLYPRQLSIDTLSLPEQNLLVTELRINPTISTDQLALPDSVTKAPPRPSVEDLPFSMPGREPITLAPSIVQVLGAWNVSEVQQDDGIVIVEGPISNGYSSKAITDAEQRFSNSKVKAVVTTSDSWPHIGGLREYAARGIPIYVLDLTRPLIDRLLAAPHREIPDAYEKTPKRPQYEIVRNRMTVGKGPNRMELIPYRGVISERQYMIYWPEHQLLYTSDLFTPTPDGSVYLPAYLQEAIEAVKREKLTVKTAFGMHYGPTPWDKFLTMMK